jgi:hypothetical protein
MHSIRYTDELPFSRFPMNIITRKARMDQVFVINALETIGSATIEATFGVTIWPWCASTSWSVDLAKT